MIRKVMTWTKMALVEYPILTKASLIGVVVLGITFASPDMIYALVIAMASWVVPLFGSSPN